ncbi:DUF4010 domain-containing protein [Methyloprofundus sedimenti]|uniref:DUF4010 domain-containing protein n=1 Tax=Methyloprofundus sedimenti TaxID=1420851 RepID=UPI001301BFA3
MLFAFITQYVIEVLLIMGFNFQSIIVGFTDIAPFILSLLSGKFSVTDRAIVSAINIASGCNNLLKVSLCGYICTQSLCLLLCIMLNINFITQAHKIISLEKSYHVTTTQQ